MQSDLLVTIQVVVIIISAKFLGRLVDRKLKQPAVIGEVMAGLIIGPFALGGVTLGSLVLHLPLAGSVVLPSIGPLFPMDSTGIFHEGLLRVLSILGAVVLMFDAGLSTSLKRFIRFAPAGLATGIGGAVLSFLLGSAAAVMAGIAPSMVHPVAMVLGVVATATSVGLTVRVLSDTQRLNTPEGATIMSAAVIDDVIGLVFLSLLVGMGAGASGVSIPWAAIGLFSIRAAVVFFGLLFTGLLLRWKISRLLMKLGGLEAAAVVALAFGLLAASMAEACGLALIVGAYVMGLSLSETDIVNVIHKSLLPIRELLVPMLFCVTGMMANFEGIGSIIPFAILYTVLISAGKILGCGIPSLPFGFNVRGACRIGVGMVPRQEVGLIVAGIALTNGLIGSDIMGAIVIMVLVTAVATPPALSMLFRGGSGMRRPVDESGDSTSRLRIPLPAHDLAVLMAENLVETFRSEGFHVFDLPIRRKSWDLRRDSKVITISIDGDDIILVTGRDNLEYTRLAFMETLTRLRNVMSEFEAMGRESIRGLLYTPEDTGN